MEITLNIPQNDYVQPTEVRQEVVQAICNWFLLGEHRIYHPVSEGCYRRKHLYVWRKAGTIEWSGLCSEKENDEEYSRIRGVEMNAAFRALTKAGYHMFRVYEYGSWMGYCCSRKPKIERSSTRVTEFTDFID